MITYPAALLTYPIISSGEGRNESTGVVGIGGMNTLSPTVRTVLALIVGVVLGAAVAATSIWVLTPTSPEPTAVAKFTQAAGTDLYGRGIWSDDALLEAGMVVCDADGPAGGAGQEDALQQWGDGIDQFTAVTIMHHANARLCPQS